MRPSTGLFGFGVILMDVSNVLDLVKSLPLICNKLHF